MEDFSGLENGQKFRNDADESKWAKLISAIKENSLRFGSKLLITPDCNGISNLGWWDKSGLVQSYTVDSTHLECKIIIFLVLSHVFISPVLQQ